MESPYPHRRYNPLLDEWVLVSPQRILRPWQGDTVSLAPVPLPAHDPACYLCPRNQRAGGIRNPDYPGVFVFDNDFPALTPEPTVAPPASLLPLLLAAPETGLCRVVCFSPRHDLGLSRLPPAALASIVSTWTAQTVSLAAHPELNYVMIFENRGEMMGCSNPHPHGQIWASHSIPHLPARELHSLVAYRHHHGRCLLCEYAALEHAQGLRIVAENDGFLALVPFWAVWPFEVMILSRAHRASLPDLTPAEAAQFSELLQQVVIRFDNLFQSPFPYSFGIHQAPCDGQPHPEAHFHAHFLPPLLRSASIRKFLVGYELLAMPQRDLTPEDAAARLRALSPIHFQASARS